MNSTLKIKLLASLLQEETNKCMSDFAALGRQAKQMQKDKRPYEDIEEHYILMSRLLSDMAPVESIIRDQNPSMCELFDLLKQFSQESNDRTN